MDEAITMDQGGRIVIPAALRRRHHLVPGSRLRVSEEGNRLILEPLSPDTMLEERDGLLVARGRLLDPGFDHRTTRDERLDRLGGLG